MPRESEVIRNWNDLKNHGIICLTGEACGLSLRLLCDLTPRGRAYLEEFFGGHIEIQIGSNWNASEGQDASILLPYGMLKELAAFLLIKAGHEVAVVRDGEIRGMSLATLHEYEQLDESFFKPQRIVKAIGTAVSTGGTRNTHVMSGRVI